MSYWLSFVDNDRPKGRRFLGCVIVPGDDVVEAVQAAHLLGCNPGGEVLGVPIAQSLDVRIGAEWRGRLLTREECEEFDAQMERKGELS